MNMRCTLMVAALIIACNITYAHETADALYQEAVTLAQQNQITGIQKLHEVIALDPTHVQANFLLGFFAQLAGNYQDAINYYQRAATSGDTRFNFSPLFNNWGSCSLMVGDLAAAKVKLEKAVALSPDNNLANKTLGEIYLLESDFARGWTALEKSWGADWPTRKSILQAEDLTGVTILLHDGDGFGDTFNWLRYAKIFKKRNATVYVKARPALIPIFKQCDYIDKIIPSGEKLPPFTVEVGFLQLTPVFCNNVEDIPYEIPYITTVPEREAFWAQELSTDNNFRIGICWECKTYIENLTQKVLEKKRAIPLMQFYPISKMSGVSLYSLQLVDGLDQLNNIPIDFHLHLFGPNFDKQFGKFIDTAAVMKNLHLIITIDTSIAHLAGALGVPVWVLLPYIADWRWFRDRDDSPWYPTMRLFRQKSLGNWQSVMHDVEEALKELINQNTK